MRPGKNGVLSSLLQLPCPPPPSTPCSYFACRSAVQICAKEYVFLFLHIQVVYTYAAGLQWCAEVAGGLAFLHAQTPCIIHRDVKLENVLLTKGMAQPASPACG